MDEKENTGTESSAVTAIKVKVVIDTNKKELDQQFNSVKEHYKEKPVKIAFGVSQNDTIRNINDALDKVVKSGKLKTPKVTLDVKIDQSKVTAQLNTEPVSMNDLGIIMQKSSAAMFAAGNTYQETLSLAAAVNGVLQDADTSGTFLKTLSMYLRASKTDAENAGIATDGMADSVSELRSELKQLAGVDIMKDNNTFKSTYQIMKELSEVWKDLSDTTQANITELISGKRGGQSASALLNNFSVAEDAMKQALNSSGSAMRENQTYMDSLQAKLNQLDSTFQKFSTDLMKSDIPKFFVSLATVFVDGADSAVKFAGALPTLTAAISGVLSVMQMSGKLKNGAGKVNMPSYICCV